MDIDFIKWMVGYAEGFELVENSIGWYLRHEGNTFYNGTPIFRSIRPLLTQRAIEGINTEGKYKIISDDVTYTVFANKVPEILIIAELKNDKRDYDQAKFSALKYIHREEKS